MPVGTTEAKTAEVVVPVQTVTVSSDVTVSVSSEMGTVVGASAAKANHTSGAPSVKRQKVEQSVRLQCGFIIPRKQRQCGMTRRAGQDFCAVHSTNPETAQKRVACPQDGRHSVWEKDLQRHLLKCRVGIPNTYEVWYKENLNLPQESERAVCAANTSVASSAVTGDITAEDFAMWIPVIETVFSAFAPLPFIQHNHASLSLRLGELGNQKHAIQQASLIGHLHAEGLLVPKGDAAHIFMEFGCGRAELSRYVNQAALHHSVGPIRDGASGFVLIDRASNRNKLEQKLVKDYYEANAKCPLVQADTKKAHAPSVLRMKVDIKDLLLDEVVKMPEMAKFGDRVRFIGISKHLCGAATDLTLRCIQNSLEMVKNMRFKGLVVAMCCRHCCAYDIMLPGAKQFLTTRGLDARAFAVMMKMASWAVSGRRPGMADEDLNGHISGLTVKEREEIGLKARRIIDESRRFALESSGFDVKLCHYVERDISLENVCLIIKPKGEGSESP
ncbi:hypothetical protein BABINDRAFT_163781 [Babjeviella inositovora NRRL Y-12698]|uniref:tRNA:m(4)X modification enzyme TRM13 n=1 Tax=Babjeviella inositovora NRRL Y-12698 TaxID=984486 RepID=A0A1E3QJ85_9ASCO|nr:uncharacterized protein BABINDRAFT_163781 [Babjeviella inositovora NRRL Y-12698]ODQ77047.1 hypothetical protein BABINDRAFT_163781 [Babjeviella inositovora NRRL Y-12698]